MSVLVILLAAAATVSAPVAIADPLIPARAGKVQCYQPDPARKTCQSIGAYSFEPDGRIINVAEVVVVPSQSITVRIEASVTVRDGQVCGFMTGNEAIEVFVSGEPADVTTAAAVRAELARGMAVFKDKEVCTRQEPGDGTDVARATVSGVEVPEMDQPVMWVEPADGWLVKP